MCVGGAGMAAVAARRGGGVGELGGGNRTVRQLVGPSGNLSGGSLNCSTTCPAICSAGRWIVRRIAGLSNNLFGGLPDCSAACPAKAPRERLVVAVATMVGGS